MSAPLSYLSTPDLIRIHATTTSPERREMAASRLGERRHRDKVAAAWLEAQDDVIRASCTECAK